MKGRKKERRMEENKGKKNLKRKKEGGEKWYHDKSL
jgi:hypothetical protein